jgi:hypothetical protein
MKKKISTDLNNSNDPKSSHFETNNPSINLKDGIAALKKSTLVKSKRAGDTGVGYQTEYDLDIPESNLDGPDKEGKEIKSTRDDANSRITLFTKNPLPKGTNTKVKEKYGYYDKDWTSVLILCPPSITPFEFSKCQQNEFGFKLVIDEENKKIVLLVKNYKSDKIEEIFSYSFDLLRSTIQKKLKDIIFLTRERKIIDGEEHFGAIKEVVESNEYNFERFLQLLKEGRIIFEIRIDVHSTRFKKDGTRNPKYGKPHDHNNAFRINRNEIFKKKVEKN